MLDYQQLIALTTMTPAKVGGILWHDVNIWGTQCYHIMKEF